MADNTRDDDVTDDDAGSGGNNDDFWGDDPAEGSRPPRRERSGGSGAEKKVLPIVAAAAALLLIVVIFVATRSDSSKKATGSTTTTEPAAATSGGKTPTTAKKPAKKKRLVWNSGVAGPPVYFRGPDNTVPAGQNPPPGVYFWEGFDGWHVRVVKGPGVGGVKGQLLSNDKLTVKKVVGGAGNTATSAEKTIDFALSDGGDKINGFDFSVAFYGTSVVLRIDSGAAAGTVHLGANATPAAGNPVSVQKVPAP